MKLINGNDTKSIRQLNFEGGYFLKMQVIATWLRRRLLRKPPETLQGNSGCED
jgi:hypothetical protein